MARGQQDFETPLSDEPRDSRLRQPYTFVAVFSAWKELPWAPVGACH